MPYFDAHALGKTYPPKNIYISFLTFQGTHRTHNHEKGLVMR